MAKNIIDSVIDNLNINDEYLEDIVCHLINKLGTPTDWDHIRHAIEDREIEIKPLILVGSVKCKSKVDANFLTDKLNRCNYPTSDMGGFDTGHIIVTEVDSNPYKESQNFVHFLCKECKRHLIDHKEALKIWCEKYVKDYEIM